MADGKIKVPPGKPDGAVFSFWESVADLSISGIEHKVKPHFCALNTLRARVAGVSAPSTALGVSSPASHNQRASHARVPVRTTVRKAKPATVAGLPVSVSLHRSGVTCA